MSCSPVAMALAGGLSKVVLPVWVSLSLCLGALPARVIPFPKRVPSENPSEASLVAAACAGRRTAQHALYTRHFSKVHARVTRLLGRAADADDVVQDAFVAAFRDLEQLAEPERFGSWLCSIAVHLVHRRLRRRALLRRLGFTPLVDDRTLAGAVDAMAGPFVQTMLRQVDAGLEMLPAPQRIAWTLRYVEGCSLDETAQQCGVSLATVKRQIARAEEQLRCHIDWEAP